MTTLQRRKCSKRNDLPTWPRCLSIHPKHTSANEREKADTSHTSQQSGLPPTRENSEPTPLPIQTTAHQEFLQSWRVLCTCFIHIQFGFWAPQEFNGSTL